MKAQCFTVTVTNFIVSYSLPVLVFTSIRCRSWRIEYQKWLWFDERLYVTQFV